MLKVSNFFHIFVDLIFLVVSRRRKKENPLLQNITIEDVAAEGKAIARHNDMVVFVPFAVPGDVVDLQVLKMRKRYMEAKVVHVHSYSETRIPAFCKHFGVCGGCKWQILPYSEQLKYKQQQVVDALYRIGKIELPEIQPILPSQKTTYYRNKLEYTFSSSRWLSFEEMDNPSKDLNALGFHIPKLFDKILDIEQCHLQAEPSNSIRLAIKEFAVKQGYSFYNQRNHEGFLRNLIIRTSTTGEVMVIMVFGENMKKEIAELLDFVKERFASEISSLMYVINSKWNDSYADLEVFPYSGNDHIFETMEDLKFRIGPKSFYQTNSDQAYQLYKIVREFAGLSGEELVYDLYTGTGTIACFVAHQAKKVVGIEYIDEAVKDAYINAELNKLDNVSFFAGDMKDILNESFIRGHGAPDVIITDPPRAGMHESVVKVLLLANPQKIVYVSCNPATQARDLELLDINYKVTRVMPVDMFPHTHHVENIVLLEKR